jgi:hypothetical protein
MLTAAASTAQAARLAKGAKLTVLWRLAALLGEGLENCSEISGRAPIRFDLISACFLHLNTDFRAYVHTKHEYMPAQNLTLKEETCTPRPVAAKFPVTCFCGYFIAP